MFIRLLCCIALLANKSAVAADFELSEDYESQTGAEKQAELWSIIEGESGTTGSFSTFFESFLFFFEDVNPSMDHEADSLPYNHGKRIHGVGSIAKATWESTEDHSYTGLFSGETKSIIRLSLTRAQSASGFAPGIAVKLFRDGMPSANFVAMIGFAGQSSGNFFENPFSNHVPGPNGFLSTLAARKFARASSPARMVGLSDIASFDQEGMAVTGEITSPYKLSLVPNANLTSQFEGSDPETNVQEGTFANIPSGTKLYDIFAFSGPEDTDGQKIAELKTDSDIISSVVSDDFVFFRHQRMSEDYELNPEWETEISPETRRLCPRLHQYH